MNSQPIDLYELMPAIYQIEDAKKGYPLRALLEIISEQANIIHQDIGALWDNFFIETCDDWVIPYLADLVGNNPIHEAVQGRRADVAKTIYYRLRKGTLPMLEELAHDVTGWSVHAVAFFQLINWTQHLNHLRRQAGSANLRDIDQCGQTHGPFDSFSHTVDVRPICRQAGWHNIRKVGFFAWRLGNYRLRNVTPRQAANQPYGYHFSPLGNPAPLFNCPQREIVEDKTATEIHVAAPIRPAAFYFTPQAYYGREQSLSISIAGVELPVTDVLCKNLANWEQPLAKMVAIDVARGRFAFGPAWGPDWEALKSSLMVSYNYGFSADLGGGNYDRRQQTGQDTVLEPDRLDFLWTIPADFITIGGATQAFGDAIIAWEQDTQPGAVIQIDASATYTEDLVINPTPMGAALAPKLVIQASNGQRPTLHGKITIPAAGAPGNLTLNGLVVAGEIEVEAASKLQTLEISHCTLVPGCGLDENGQPTHPAQASLTVNPGNDLLKITMRRSITGALCLPAEMVGLEVSDTIIDGLPDLAGDAPPAPALAGNLPGPPTTLERVTVFGPVHVRQLGLASEVIFTGPVTCQRRQVGCIRFSYVPDGSVTPRRYRCQPDEALVNIDRDSAEYHRILAQLSPMFTSRAYGQPAYAQLRQTAAEAIRTGAADGAEMGVYQHLRQPQRAANLMLRLEEYLPFGLEADLICIS